MLIGEKGQGIREVHFFLAKVVPDPLRQEPRNSGLIVRLAESKELHYRFMDEPPVQPFWPYTYRKTMEQWADAITRYQSRCLHFIGKREGNKYANSAIYIEPAMSRMVAGRVNFDEAYKRLVLPGGESRG